MECLTKRLPVRFRPQLVVTARCRQEDDIGLIRQPVEHGRRNLDAAGWKVDYVVTHEAPADLAGDLCWECNRPFEDDPLQNFLGEIDRRLDFKTWFFGHYHDDEWRDGRHRLIYRDIVPVGVRREDEDREPVG